MKILVILAAICAYTQAVYFHEGQWKGEGLHESQWKKEGLLQSQWHGEGLPHSQWHGEGWLASQYKYGHGGLQGGYGGLVGGYGGPVGGYHGPIAHIELTHDGKYLKDTPEVAHAKAQHLAALAAASHGGYGPGYGAYY